MKRQGQRGDGLSFFPFSNQEKGKKERPSPVSLGKVLRRKAELVEASTAQRQALARHTAGLAPVFSAGDKVLGVGRSLLAHPLLLAGAGGLLLALWPRRVVPLLFKGFALWRGLSGLRRLLRP